eukprot:TRINITY_DN12922_c0_g2_i1.p1 TRINITY_DN12922_c0_g2~~TRINITY_DN12922_c0_g2_i1.p1  ORF type:complete len:356 (-),score=80.74 TRINITY_DN12922_c0_g2_i1:136-1203(-)
MHATTTLFGRVGDRAVTRIDLSTTDQRFAASFIDFGATVISFQTPNRHGERQEVTINYDNIEDFVKHGRYFGSTVGRCCNRIAFGKMNLGGKEYQLPVNNGPNHLHGGPEGWDVQTWAFETQTTDDSATVVFSYESADGEQGYPGKVFAEARYTLMLNGTLLIDFRAKAEDDTVVNMTNHVYWNLNGTSGQTDILNHVLNLSCEEYLPVNENKIPTGEFVNVSKTPMDFTTERPIGSEMDPVEGGFDHCFRITPSSRQCFVLSQETNLTNIKYAATLSDTSSGRVMDVYTTQPGIQIYTANHFDGLDPRKYGKHAGVCLETQHFPDSVNHSNFPSILLKKGEVYRQVTVHTFSTV